MSNPITGQVEIPELIESPVGVDAGPKFGFHVLWDMTEGGGKQFQWTSLTSKQLLMEIHCIRGRSGDVTVAARTSWDGVPDTVQKLRTRNYAYNDASVGSQIVGVYSSQNRAGGRIYWMRTLDVEVDNRGTVGDAIKALRVSVRNNSVVTADVVGIEIELLSQAAAGGEDIALDLIHNDASSASHPVGINLKASRATNGFVYALRTEQYGIDKMGQDSAASAMFKFYDDGENCDLDIAVALNDIKNTANTGWIKVIIGSTVRYIAVYSKKT